AANADPRSELLVCAGLLCWGLLCLVTAPPALVFAVTGFTALAVFASLAKMTLLFPAVLSVWALAGWFFFCRRTRVALGMVFGFFAAFFLTWTFLGQALSNLGAFLKYGFLVSFGYDKAMWGEPFPQMLLPGVIISVLTATIIAVRSWGAVGRAEP